MGLDSFDAALRRVFREPKFRAQMEWLAENEIRFDGWPREEMEFYVRTGRHVRPDRRVRVVLPGPMPDWDWWEPRYDQPWRRQVFGVW